MPETPRRALRALAQRHGLSDRSLTLIKEATIRLSDDQIRIVCDAVETCLLSGLSEDDIAPVIEEHRARAPQDWCASFWRERLALANARYAVRERAAGHAPGAPGSNGGRSRMPPVAPIGPQPPETMRPAPKAVGSPPSAQSRQRAAPIAPIGPQPPEQPQEPAVPVAPIPPQPPGQVAAYRREPAGETAPGQQSKDTAARRAA
jgi:hypothetical protein